MCITDNILIMLTVLLDCKSEIWNYSKTCLKWSLKNRQNKDLNDK